MCCVNERRRKGGTWKQVDPLGGRIIVEGESEGRKERERIEVIPCACVCGASAWVSPRVDYGSVKFYATNLNLAEHTMLFARR